jgi:hypothetical protein
MRDTKYATELKTASLSLPNNEEARFERLYVKGTVEGRSQNSTSTRSIGRASASAFQDCDR